MSYGQFLEALTIVGIFNLLAASAFLGRVPSSTQCLRQPKSKFKLGRVSPSDLTTNALFVVESSQTMRLPIFALAFACSAITGFAETKEIAIKVDGKEALSLSVPKDADVKTKGDKTTIIAPHVQVYVWVLPDAKTVAAVVPKAAEVIKSEFVKFAVKSTDSLKVAEHEAKLVKGSGEEADDERLRGQPMLFSSPTAKSVFAACVHGENDDAESSVPDLLLKILASIKLPGK